MLSQNEIGEIKELVGLENDRLSVIFSALSDPGRLRIFKLLMKHHDICVTDVARIFEISLISHENP